MALNVIIISHYLFIYLTADDNPAATVACVLSPVTRSAVERTERRSAADLSVSLFRNLEKLGANLECFLNPLLGATLGCKSSAR